MWEGPGKPLYVAYVSVSWFSFQHKLPLGDERFSSCTLGVSLMGPGSEVFGSA